MAGDVAMTVFTCFLWAGSGLWLLIQIAVIFCCGQSAEERAAAERRAALETAYSLARRRLAAVEVELMPPVVLPVPAAAPVVAKKLEYFPYSAEGRSASSEYLECAICLGVFEQGEECSAVPACRHLFHRDCIGVWLKTNTSCPLCRRRILTGSSQPVPAADDMV